MDTHPSPHLVAVATKDQRQIDLHFGHADRFHVYRLDSSGPVFVELRDVEHYCQGGYGDEDKREAILRALADCSALFVAKAGDGPKARLRAAGIEPVDDYAYGAVLESLIEWQRTRPSA